MKNTLLRKSRKKDKEIENRVEKLREIENCFTSFNILKGVPEKEKNKNVRRWPGTVAHTCDSSSLGGQGGWIT